MLKTVIRASVVVKALVALDQQQEQLATEGILAVRVYVDHRLTPESFPRRINQGAVILYFTRKQPTDHWQLDDNQFSVLHRL
ncbi:MAG: hypothetical protein EOO61_12275 [Hymenobacter sp.]|nr:MAG: hypothetical protein EOO61_12275 [Hymenobacter sp.]